MGVVTILEFELRGVMWSNDNQSIVGVVAVSISAVIRHIAAGVVRQPAVLVNVTCGGGKGDIRNYYVSLK